MPIGWIDFSKSDRDKVNSILDMLGEKATLDELGIAPIRDGFADIFFPGTTTIQTRAKYFFLVPYELRDIELSKLAESNNLMGLLRKSEHDTGKALYEQDPSEHSGVIGRRILRNNGNNWVKRTPAEIYWAGLRRYDIFRNNISLTEYLQYVAAQKRNKENILSMGNRNDKKEERDDADAGDVPYARFWNLPDTAYLVKEEWRKTLSMKLDKEEGSFLKRQIHMTCPDSMMDYLLQNNLSDVLQGCDYFQDLEKCKYHFPDSMRQDYEMALNFSNFVYLLRILYNRICRQETFELAENAWKEKQNHIKEYSASLDIDGIFIRLRLLKQGRNKWLYNFLKNCQQALLHEQIEKAEDEITKREVWLKGEARSRTVNKLPGDILDWFTGGELDYRYGNAKTIMNDIFESEAE